MIMVAVVITEDSRDGGDDGDVNGDGGDDYDDDDIAVVMTRMITVTVVLTKMILQVMRDMTSGSADKAVSKEYAFVTFSQHEDALAALR